MAPSAISVIAHPKTIQPATGRLEQSAYVARWFDARWHTYQRVGKTEPRLTDIPFHDAFHGVRRALQYLKEPEQFYVFYFSALGLVMPKCIPQILSSSLQIVVPFFSSVKAALHMEINSLPPTAYCYSELETLSGYPIVAHRVQDDSPYAWLSEPVHDAHPSSWWMDRITSTWHQHAVRRPRQPVDLRTFIHNRWLWVTGGAASDSKACLDGKPVQTKFGAAISLSDQELYDLVNRAIQRKNRNIKIFVKQDERGFKKRLIANVSLGGYLIAAYVRYLIECYQGVNPRWMTGSTSVEQDLEVISLLQQGRRAVPLDESKFDYHVSREQWLGFIEALKQTFPLNEGVAAFERMFHVSRWYDIETGSSGQWLKGMPSGLALTSMCNTLFNYVKQQAVESPIHYALGDDALFFNEEVTLEQLEQYYATFGSEVNPKKNWESTQYAEFLHYLYTRHGKVGYPARIFGSLLYGLKFTDPDPMSRVWMLTGMWKSFYNRAGLAPDWRVISADISRAVSRSLRWSKAKYMEWLHAAPAYGGFGLWPWNFSTVSVKNTEARRIYYTNVLIKPAPQVVYGGQAVAFGKRSGMPRPFHRWRPPSSPPIRTIEQWELQLQGVDPWTGQRSARDQTGLIPLPQLDCVSVDRMSKFAEVWNYYSYGNMSGDAQTQKERLTSAAVSLISAVQKWLSDHAVQVYC